ncbi:VC0807 family protein [Kutzneria sp. NPDC052558]|uniref:VC0807 family protein n=1 Tax=Kutzneria sp. NPDC052558 TaxID=3364121 RepID=UPI0037CBA8A6
MTTTQQIAAGRTPESGRVQSPLSSLLSLVLDIGLPLGAYYLAKGVFGLDVITSLIVSGLAPAARTIWTTVRSGRPDQFALAVLIVTLVSIPITLLTGSPTFMLAKEGLGTATLGIYIGVMALRRQPVMSAAFKPFMANSAKKAAAWDSLVAGSPEFRAHLVRANLVWAVGFVLEVALRLTIVFTLPFDTAVWATNFPLFIAIVGCSVVQRRWLVPAAIMVHLAAGEK